jgi:seryl-tRNA synthetase
MANLFEINKAIMNAWEACVDPETGEINEDIYAEMEALQVERDEKIENIACWAKNLMSDAAQLKAEAKTMADRAASAEKKAESLKRYLAAVLNGTKFETTRCIIGWRKSTAVLIEPDADLPEEYVRTKVTTEPDKTAIKAALTSGKEIAGCSIETRNNLTLK